MEALRQELYEKAGPFRAPDEPREYFPAAAQAQLTQLEKERKDLESSKPEFPQAMGVADGSHGGDLADSSARQPLDARQSSAAPFPAASSRETTSPPFPQDKAAACNLPNG